MSTADLEVWMRKRNGGAVTKQKYRVHLSGLFNFALKRQHIRTNPATALTTPKDRSDRRPAVL